MIGCLPKRLALLLGQPIAEHPPRLAASCWYWSCWSLLAVRFARHRLRSTRSGNCGWSRHAGPRLAICHPHLRRMLRWTVSFIAHRRRAHRPLPLRHAAHRASWCLVLVPGAIAGHLSIWFPFGLLWPTALCTSTRALRPTLYPHLRLSLPPADRHPWSGFLLSSSVQRPARSQMLSNVVFSTGNGIILST